MHGFTPATKRAQAQHLAEGGLVRGLVRKVMGIPEPTDTGFAAPTAAPAAPPPAPAPAPEKAITQYAGMGATERRIKAMGLKDGGPVRGPGTGTSDSIETEVRPGSYIMPADSTEKLGEDGIAALGFSPGKVPVNLSDGEYQLPPEQVHAVGVEALDAIKDATHAPASGPRGFAPSEPEPPVLFANGGLVDDEVRKPRPTTPTAALDVSTSIPAPLPMLSASLPPSPQALQLAANKRAAATPAPAPASQTSPLAQTQGAAFGVFRREPTAGTRGGMMQPYVATGPASFEPAKVQDGTGRLDAFNDPRSTLFRGGDGTTPAPTSRGFAGVGEGWGSGAQPAVTAPTAPPAVRPAATAPVVALITAPASTETAPAVAAPSASQVMPGVFRQGNSYGDSPAAAAAGFAPRSGPSAQNMAAADAIEARGIAARAGERAGAADGAARGFSPGSGLTVIGDDSHADRVRRAAFGAASTAYRGAPNGQLTANQVRTLAGMDEANARNAVTRDTTAANNAAALEREAMQQSGATGRTLVGEAGANARAGASNDVQRGELALRQEAQGFQTRGAQRVEKLYEQYEKAKPEERAAIGEQIRTLTGKEHTNRFTVVAGGQEVDPTTQQLTTRPARVFNNQTGQFVDQAQPARAGLPPGMTKQVGTSGGKPVYEDAQGKRFVAN
ncbi:hypothetical protein JVX96_24240 [Variovorax sp. PDNC026]|uniref:hypothetical protein n=1 Tax=Variovorax sp. PDNC026 TaxID=2811425 RepID=UPI001963DA42|nr:hypothetical protein [Variovorax sp. PDNC026]QRY31158.1 hypothetical protein JVX96_24240 [Variovorax sp. PDNC026]